MRKLPDRWPTNLEEIAADPDNMVVLPAESGLRFPVIIYGGWNALGRAFGEVAREADALQRKEKSYGPQADCQGLPQTQPETI